MMISRALLKKVALVAGVSFALLLLRDYDEDEQTQSHHFAFVTALRRHPPCLRVFRALIEITMVLFATATSIHVWSRAAGRQVVGLLLFQIPPKTTLGTIGRYQLVSVEEDNDDDDDDSDSDLANEEKEVGALDDDKLEEEELEAFKDEYIGEIPVEGNKHEVQIDFPTATSVIQAAFDLLLFILVSLFLFTLSSAEGGRYIKGIKDMNMFEMMANFAAPIFPLALFVGALLWSVLPWRRRCNFWVVLSFTLQAPFCDVTFRDGFIGDVLTSSVRPLQDLAFTLFYVFSGLKGWWTQDYDLDEAASPVESNWLLRTVILPACMISPLWWRFMQNLRQSYETKQRWPYLGNAFKYFAAAQVAMFGVFDPRRNGSPPWLACFVLSTLYQVWWDVFMDWELLSYQNGKVGLRKRRLYSSTMLYWIIFVVNFILRFGWTLSFLPSRYLDKAGTLRRTFKGGLSGIIEPTLASAEIVRRMLWGFLRFELEGVKAHSDNPVVRQRLKLQGNEENDGIEMKGFEKSAGTSSFAASALPGSFAKVEIDSDLSNRSNAQILLELTMWATAFATGGIVAAAHRGTF